MWNFLRRRLNKTTYQKPDFHEKRNGVRSPSVQKAVLISQPKIVFRILDLSSSGAQMTGPQLKNIFAPDAPQEAIEFLIHYGGAQYKKVRGLVRWTQARNGTFGVQFIE